MLEKINTLGRQRIAAIDLQNIYAQIVVATPYTNNNGYSQVKLEKLVSVDNLENLKESLSKEKLSLLSYIASGAETLAEVTTTTISATNLANLKADYGINDTNHTCDYFNFTNSAIICAFPLKSSTNTSQILSQINSSINVINQSDVALVNFYNKIYVSSSNSRTAIITIGSEHVSLIVISNQIPICIGSLKVKAEETKPFLRAIATLFREASSMFPKDPTAATKLDYDLALLVGECDESILRDIAPALASTQEQQKEIVIGSIEFFNPLMYSYVSIEALTEREKQLVQSQGYKYSAAIAAADMGLGYSGVDLSVNKEPLFKDFSKDVYFYTPQSYLLKSLDFVDQVVEKVKYAVATQTTVLIVALISAISLIGYNYYEANQQINVLDKSISEKKVVLESLKGVKEQYQQYQGKVKIKNDRIKTIQDIQLTQLTVPTILTLLENAQRPLNGFMKFNAVEISNRVVNVTGESIDKAQTITFLKSLSQTGAFIDVNPTYDSSDSIKCKYNLTTSYTGPVRGNPIVLPTTNTTEVAQINSNLTNTSVNSNTSSNSNNTPKNNTANSTATVNSTK